MERELFTWKTYDNVGEDRLQFYDVVTIVDIGNINSKTHFDAACIDYNEGTLEFYEIDNENPVHNFRLNLSVLQIS